MKVYAWDVKEVAKEAAEKKAPVQLVRADGSSSGLCVEVDGKLRRVLPKPQGKSARKELKKLRRTLRTLQAADSSPTAQAVLKRRMAELYFPTR